MSAKIYSRTAASLPSPLGEHEDLVAESKNFGFLAAHHPLLADLPSWAETYFVADPVTSLMKLRQFGERLAKRVAALSGLQLTDANNQYALINRLSDDGHVTPQAAEILNGIRSAGNTATHYSKGSHKQALRFLHMGYKLAVWFHSTFGDDAKFKPGPFLPPKDPENPSKELLAELEHLRVEAEAALPKAQRHIVREGLDLPRTTRARRSTAELQAIKSAEGSLDKRFADDDKNLSTLAEKADRSPTAKAKRRKLANKAERAIDLSEAETRILIDEQLRLRGWECDSDNITFAAGSRPHKKKNLAIAEWPTASGPVDYALFCGMTCVGVIEAKRVQKDVPSVLEQAKRYSCDLTTHGAAELPQGSPWRKYKVPFIFATNGRPYLRQIETKSGIWFWDARYPKKVSRATGGWYTPMGLQKLLAQDETEAHKALASEELDYLQLRNYQEDAIVSVEKAIAAGKRECLLAMATGTGKTRTAIGLVYRLIKSGRFRRVLFLVDRSSLGDQAAGAFKNVKLQQAKSFSDIYDVKDLDDIAPDDDTRLQISTIQGTMRRVLFPSDEENIPAVDQYDCIVVDEAHRGYNLDKEMSEAEMEFRSEADYVSKYRRILDYFDSVKVALTATPALHTTEIFGDPVYTYSYRDAVIDGYLVDQEPPYRIQTKLGKGGITFAKETEVKVYNPNTQTIDLVHAPDDVDIEIDGFNRKVITENFNRTVCQELARHIDPSLPGKTLVFALTRDHADMVVKVFKEALEERYGEIDEDAVTRITGDIDKPLEMIRRFKNEQMPKIGVTVDLLTTGIDVPEITNLVFLRRVKSRILYEQMKGRATRLCPDIGKEYFRVFDCVDLFAALEPMTNMRPVVQNPNIRFGQLVQELHDIEDQGAREVVFDQLIAKLQAKTRLLKGEALEDFCNLADANDPKEVIQSLRKGTIDQAVEWLSEHNALIESLDAKSKSHRPYVFISEHEDEIESVERGYRDGEKPADYLEGFKEYLQTHINDIPALLVITQRPRELTREQLREVKRLLDKDGYNVAALRTAHKELTNQDVAASIIGFIRQQALGEALVPYAERVDGAMKKILASQPWTSVQRKWLERIAKQIQEETIVDRSAMDQDVFRDNGGFKRFDKIFDGHLEELLGDISEAIWAKTA